MTVAAVGDLHLQGTDADVAVVESVMNAASDHADVLAICGDLTSHGRVEEVRAFAQAIGGFPGTVLIVLGNHDHESDCAAELVDILEAAGAVVLDGDAIVLNGVGFAGVKGFGGGVGADVSRHSGSRLSRAL